MEHAAKKLLGEEKNDDLSIFSIANQLLSIHLNQRQVCDIELILNGGFSPLDGFLSQADYDSVLDNMCLLNGDIWPIPITLDVNLELARSLEINSEIALRDAEGLILAILKVQDIWKPDKIREAKMVFGTEDDYHPGVNYLYHQTDDYYLGGELIGVTSPCHYDFKHLRFTPQQLRYHFHQQGWKKIVAFQTRNPMHRAHQALSIRAMEQTDAALLIHPVVGMTKPGDFEYYTRVRCYEHVIKTYPENQAMLALLPLAMRMAGPKEALWHALIRKNYGCTHFIVGRDHAGPGKNRFGQLFYEPYAAQELTLALQDKLGIEIIPFQEMVYSQKQNRYFPVNEFPSGEEQAAISGTELRDRIRNNDEIPEWYSYPAVIDELRKLHPPRHEQGFTILMTGLPCAGKSTLANLLSGKLREKTGRQITLLDGDVIRKNLSQDLGFSRQDRETNISRVGFVAKEITRHGGIVICALIAPFEKTRKQVRQMITEVGGFIEIYISTPLDVCETRDRKGFYKKARAGEIKQFTGISDPYELPLNPEISVNTNNHDPDTNADLLLKQISLLGYIR